MKQMLNHSSMVPPHRPGFLMSRGHWLCLVLLFLASVSGAVFGADSAIATYAFGASSIVRDDTRDRVYVAIPTQNSVAVIDSGSLQLLATVFVGSQPSALSVSTDGSVLYVALSGSSNPGIVVLDLSSLSVVRSITTTAAVRSIAVSSSTIYSLESSAIRAYNTSDGTALSGQMTNQGGLSIYGGLMKISPDLSTLYYYQTGLSPSSWFRINLASWPGTVAQSGQWGSNGQDMALSADGQWITFASGSPYSVSKLKATDPTVSVGLLNTGAYPHAVTYSPDGNTIFTAHQSGSIDVWNANTYVQTSTIVTTGEPDCLKVDRKGLVLFAGTTTGVRAYYIGSSSGTPINAQINHAVEITWNSTYGNLYQVEWSNAPNGPNWYSLGGQTLGNGLTMSVFDTTRGASTKFYRVRQVSP
jgi:YVTN family beta-propeller protein